MNSQNSPRLASIMFFVSTALLAVLVVMQVGSGVTQQWYELGHAVGEYEARLLAQAVWFRAIVAVDDVFVAAYCAAVILLGLSLKQWGSGLWPLVVVAGALGGVLDLEENHHMLAMLSTVQHGGHLDTASLEHRMVLSSLKWLVGPLAYCFFGLGFEARTGRERVVKLFSWVWMLPLTAVVLVVDDATWGRPLGLLRLVSVVFGFAMIGSTLRARSRESGSGARV